jgi:hypothetical protein
MAPYACWVKESFKQTLIDSCDKYLDRNDRGNEKHWSKLITRVADEIGAIAKDKTEDVPDDLEKYFPVFVGVITTESHLQLSSVCGFGLETTRPDMPRKLSHRN